MKFSSGLPLLIVLCNLAASQHEDHQNQTWIQVLLSQHVDSTKHPQGKDYTENLKEKKFLFTQFLLFVPFVS